MTETSDKPLSKPERRLILLLGIPGGALQLCLAILSTYVPVLARQFTSSTTTIGALVGAEGLIAVLLPVWVGRLSDRTKSRFGRRIPFLLATAPVAAAALSLAPFAPSLAVLAIEMFFFYVAYFAYFAPYQALYPDLVPAEQSGRAQGVQGVFTNAGLGVALVGGGLLLDAWRPLPYLLAAFVLLLATAVLTIGLRGRKRDGEPNERESRDDLDHAPSASSPSPSTSPLRELWELLRQQPAIVYFVAGNAFLTLGLGGLKSFVVLWLTEGLGKSMTFTAGAMGVVAVGAVVGALVSGKLADRYGPTHVIWIALLLFGVGLGLGTFSTSIVVLGAAFPLIAIAGGAAFALPYALLMRLMPSKSHGTMAGLFDVSSGVGTLLGPTVAGAAIGLMHPLFTSTRGYGAMWPVLSVAVLVSTVLLWRAGALGERAKET